MIILYIIVRDNSGSENSFFEACVAVYTRNCLVTEIPGLYNVDRFAVKKVVDQMPSGIKHDIPGKSRKIYRTAVAISKRKVNSDRVKSSISYTDWELRTATSEATIINTTDASRLYGVPRSTLNRKLDLIAQSFNGKHGITDVTSLKKFAANSTHNASIVKDVVLKFNFPSSGAKQSLTDVEISLIGKSESGKSEIGLGGVSITKVYI